MLDVKTVKNALKALCIFTKKVSAGAQLLRAAVAVHGADMMMKSLI